ncbi:MAG: O-antigen ligase family protein [Clostridia bacterium]|nr:O-antigen ligase family protein [Clostridia bacterium]MBQ9737775.1 O-antigen ligase family protein [Clostridia bacterium]
MKNNGYFLTLWNFLWLNIIKNSFIYRIFCAVYGFLSTKWQQSVITNLFRTTFLSEGFASKSIIGKIFFSPFRLIEWIYKKCGDKLIYQTENSFIIRTFKYYLHSILALNLRFLGTLLASSSFVSLALSLFLGGGIKFECIALVLGLALLPFNICLTDFFKGSLLVKFFESLLGTNFSFDFYYVTKSMGAKSVGCAVFFGTLAGVVSAVFSPLFALLILGGLWFLFMVLYKVEFGVFVTIFLAPIIPTMAVAGLTLLCLFSLIVKALTTKKFEFKSNGTGIMVIAMIVIYFISTLTSFATFKSLQIWAVYFAFMAFYFVIINTVKTKKQLMDLLTVFCLSGFFVCFYGILQYVFNWNISQAWMDEEMFEDIRMRIYSTLENPNVLGEYILLVLPVTIALMWKKKGVLPRIFYGGIAAVMGIALILTFSRGCWIGIMASAAIFVTFAAGKLWGLAILLLPLVPMVLPESIINRFASIGDMKDSSTSYRVYIWMGTLLMLKDFWLSGIGLGTESFVQVYPFYSYSSIVAPHSHNLFLQIMVESGILGLAVFCILILTFVRKLASAHKIQGKFGDISVVLVGIGAAIIGFLVQGIFDNCFYNYRVFMIFWAQLAIGATAADIAKAHQPDLEVKEIA